MKIAVIGAGISGLCASLALSPHADVTLYEKESQLGGHANTFTIPETNISVDTGFMVYNPPRYPVFVQLIDYLGISSTPTRMSFSVSTPETEFASHSLRGLFADRRNILRQSHYSFIREIIRFDKTAQAALTGGLENETTLGTFMIKHGFSEALRNKYLYPMLASIWSSPKSRVDDFPALSTFAFLDNHQLLDPFATALWRTIPGGSQRYVLAAEEKLRDNGTEIICGSTIQKVTRKTDSVEIKSGNSVESYDCIVMATHANTALSLLSYASAGEREILSAFSYSVNHAVLHRDTSVMPARKDAWASWNYKVSAGADGVPLSVTYDMNALQHIESSTPVYVSLNPTKTILPEYVYADFMYEHPQFNFPTLRAQKRLHEIQGVNRTYFAGAHWGYGFHEDGARSGIDTAAAIGYKAPWIL